MFPPVNTPDTDLTKPFANPLRVNPVNTGEFAIPNPKFVLETSALATSLKLFAGFSGVKPKAPCLLLNVVQSVLVKAPVCAVVAFCKLIVPPATCKLLPTCKIPFVTAVAS